MSIYAPGRGYQGGKRKPAAPPAPNPFANIPTRGELTHRETSGTFTPSIPPAALRSIGLPPSITKPTITPDAAALGVIGAALTPGGPSPAEVAQAAINLGVHPGAIEAAAKPSLDNATLKAPSLASLGAAVSNLVSGSTKTSVPAKAAAGDTFKPESSDPKIRAAEVQNHKDFLAETGGVPAPVDRSHPKKIPPPPANWDLTKRNNYYRKAAGEPTVQEAIEGKGGRPKQRNPADPLGKKTLGNVTLQELQQAGRAGTLKINRKGVISTQPGRQALHQLLGARKAASRSGQGDGSVEAQVGAYLRAHGLNRIAASGILGNAFAESSFQPGAEGYGGGGLWGFTAHPNSLSDLQGYAASKGKSWEDPKTQADFLLQHVSPETIQALNASPSPEAAATVFMEQFERPGIPRQDVREEGARNAFGGSWGKPNPQAVARLQQATAAADALGIHVPAPGQKQGQVTYVHQTAATALTWAEHALGVTTGSKREVHFSELVGGVTDPWCAVFVSTALKKVGIEPPANPNYSGAFAEGWKGGTKLNTTSLSHAKPGDLLIFDWGDGGITDHVAIYKGGNQMIGGNQGAGEVSLEEVPAGNIVSIVRPKYTGKLTAVPDAVPGSTTVSAAGGGAALGGGEAAGASQQRQAVGAATALGSIPTPNTASALTPGAFNLFQLGQSEGAAPVGANVEGTIAGLLRRRKL